MWFVGWIVHVRFCLCYLEEEDRVRGAACSLRAKSIIGLTRNVPRGAPVSCFLRPEAEVSFPGVGLRLCAYSGWKWLRTECHKGMLYIIAP